MLRTALLMLVLMVSLVGGQDTPRVKVEIKGNWTLQSMINEKEKPGEETLKAMSVTIDGKTILIREGPEKQERAAYTLDPKGAAGQIDLVPEKAPKEVLLGIYELKGDVLKLSWNKGKTRSTDYKGEGAQETVLVLKRKK